MSSYLVLSARALSADAIEFILLRNGFISTATIKGICNAESSLPAKQVAGFFMPVIQRRKRFVVFASVHNFSLVEGYLREATSPPSFPVVSRSKVSFDVLPSLVVPGSSVSPDGAHCPVWVSGTVGAVRWSSLAFKTESGGYQSLKIDYCVPSVYRSHVRPARQFLANFGAVVHPTRGIVLLLPMVRRQFSPVESSVITSSCTNMLS